jgi:hypothetical protein
VSQELDQLVAGYRRAEGRLRESLLGDGLYTSGAVRGAEARDAVARELRQLRASFDAAVHMVEEGERQALEHELKLAARRAARRAEKP